ncbi:MAG: glutaminyl-peptide cyclotransferase [Kouleothrix sp.]
MDTPIRAARLSRPLAALLLVLALAGCGQPDNTAAPSTTPDTPTAPAGADYPAPDTAHPAAYPSPIGAGAPASPAIPHANPCLASDLIAPASEPMPPAATLAGQPTPASPTIGPVASPAATYGYRVVNSYPHDRAAYTEGLVYENGQLYEGTGLEAQSELRRVALESGAVLQRCALPAQAFGEGITILGASIYQLTWKNHTGVVYDKASFAPISTFSYPGEGWGLTNDGHRLIMSDGTATLRFLDPATQQEIGRVDVYDERGPVLNLNELEYVRGEIFANVWQTDRIARIDPQTGAVVGWIDLTGLLSAADRVQPVEVLNGIAYDPAGDRLFVTGKYWPRLVEIVLERAG